MKLFTVLLVLLFSIPCIALTPPEVVLVVNSASTLDTDANGVSDWRDVVVWYAAAHPDWDTSQVCSVRTYDAASGDEDEPWDFLNATIDTSNLYGTSASKNVNHDYVLDDICATFDSHGWWGQKKCVVLVMGMPLRTQHNATYDATCGAAPGSSIIWSWDDVIRVFARPSLVWNAAWHVDGGRTSRYRDAVIAGGWKPFVPGKYYNCSDALASDSLTQWLLVSRLDGLHVDDVRGMITRAAAGTQIVYSGSSFSTSRWAVIDQDGEGSGVALNYSLCYSEDSTWGVPNRFRTGLVNVFGNGQILYDSVGGTLGANPDTITEHPGYSTDQTAGGSVLFYYNNSRHSFPLLGKERYYGLNMTLANGALIMDLGSYNCITMRDTSLRGDLQPLMVEAIHQYGFTYAIGNVCEPTYSYVSDVGCVGIAFSSPYSSIAEVGQQAAAKLKMNVSLGDPLGIMGRSTVRSASTQTAGGGGWSSWR